MDISNNGGLFCVLFNSAAKGAALLGTVVVADAAVRYAVNPEASYVPPF